MYDKQYEDRLASWAEFRSTLETSHDPIQDTIDFFSHAPLVNIQTDPYTPSSWPDPWELITQPTLGTKPVSPKPKSSLLIGLLFGLTLGSFLAYRREKENGNIYDTSLLVSKLQLPILDKIS